MEFVIVDWRVSESATVPGDNPGRRAAITPGASFETMSSIQPLNWWAAHPDLASIYPLAQMLFSIPASSAEAERCFSSAGFLLDTRRTRLSTEHLRQEFRVRQYIVSGSSAHTAKGREVKMKNVGNLLRHFAAHVDSVCALPAESSA